MKKILLIISREYSTRVRKKSFILMSILGPVIFAAFIILPAWFASLEDKEEKVIAVIDNSEIFNNKIPETEFIKFKYLQNIKLDTLKSDFGNTDYYAVLYISETHDFVPKSVQLYSEKQANINVEMHIENALEKEIERLKLGANGIDENILKSIKTKINVKTFQWTESGDETQRNTGVVIAISYIGGFLIYFFIFLFGAQVMRGVLEEKTNRIVEVIVSSVRPFQLMMGKIVGIGLVALTQFMIWSVLTVGFSYGLQTTLLSNEPGFPVENIESQEILNLDPSLQSKTIDQKELAMVSDAFGYLKEIDFLLIVGSFLIFFLGGYFLYASLFAIVGAASDQDTDTQQFMLPITIPLILSIFVMINSIQNPGTTLAFWFSIIPFTSPVVMMSRIPHGVENWELILSIGLLILTFIGTTWLAGKIYRTGILMYGKKVSYKELWKWLTYKN